MERANSTGSWLTKEICRGGRMGRERPGTIQLSPGTFPAPGLLMQGVSGLKSDQGLCPAASIQLLLPLPLSAQALSLPRPTNWSPVSLSLWAKPSSLTSEIAGCLSVLEKNLEKENVECCSVNEFVHDRRQEATKTSLAVNPFLKRTIERYCHSMVPVLGIWPTEMIVWRVSL